MDQFEFERYLLSSNTFKAGLNNVKNCHPNSPNGYWHPSQEIAKGSSKYLQKQEKRARGMDLHPVRLISGSLLELPREGKQSFLISLEFPRVGDKLSL